MWGQVFFPKQIMSELDWYNVIVENENARSYGGNESLERYICKNDSPPDTRETRAKNVRLLCLAFLPPQ